MTGYCRRLLVGYREASDAEWDAYLTDVALRYVAGRCPSCALRQHECEREGCECPVPRCVQRRVLLS